jgi:hypothetical protein
MIELMALLRMPNGFIFGGFGVLKLTQKLIIFKH